jgi:hypothetical protein
MAATSLEELHAGAPQGGTADYGAGARGTPTQVKISRTVQGFPVGGEEVRALRVGQFPEDLLRVQRILVILSGLGADGVVVRPGLGGCHSRPALPAGCLPPRFSSCTTARCRLAA